MQKLGHRLSSVLDRVGLEKAGYTLPASVTDEVLTPALIVHAGAARRNVDKVVAACGGAKRWRPHVKTTKSAWVVECLLNRGVTQFKAATAREAATVAETARRLGVGADVLVAMAHSGPNLRRVANVAKCYPEHALSVVVEDTQDVPDELGVFADVNPGMDRTGSTVDAARRVAEFFGPRFRGFHVYDGHADDIPADSRRDTLFRLYDSILRALPPNASLVTSGTPAFPHALQHPGLIALGDRFAVSPGTVVFSDLTCDDQLADTGLRLEPAALVLSRVLSRPTDTRFTLDAGHKTVSADAGDPTCALLGLDSKQAAAYRPRHPSEEHLPVDVLDDASVVGPLPARGDLFYLVPRHVCPTVNNFDRAILVDDPHLQLPPRTVPVDAQGRDLWLDDPILPASLRENGGPPAAGGAPSL